MFDSASFDSIDDFVSYGENGTMTETCRYRAAAVDAGEVLVFAVAAEFQRFSMTGVKSLSSPM